jgi:hypothetical protein
MAAHIFRRFAAFPPFVRLARTPLVVPTAEVREPALLGPGTRLELCSLRAARRAARALSLGLVLASICLARSPGASPTAALLFQLACLAVQNPRARRHPRGPGAPHRPAQARTR